MLRGLKVFVSGTAMAVLVLGGATVAAVYVPTAVNPTTGYLQLVPVEKLVPSEMTSEQAMAMIISAGAVMPERMSLGVPQIK